MRIAKRQQAVARNLRNDGVGSLHAAMHGIHGAEDRGFIQRYPVGLALQFMRQDIEQDLGIRVRIDVAAID